MKIIGHRGAAGLALENSNESIRAALQHSVDEIEFDIHLTKDDQVVVIHDKHTKRIAHEKVLVREKTLAQLRALKLKNGQRIPTLDEILTLLGSKPVVIDIKDEGSADKLLQILKRHPKANVRFASFKHTELQKLHAALPKVPIYVLEHFSPVEIVRSARSLGATGVGLNKWLMNPLTYRLAKQYHLQFYLYTVNSRRLAKFIHRLYPDIDLCTDHPERMKELR